MGRKEYRIGRFTLEPFRQLMESGQPVPVKPKALAILSVLAEAKGTLVTKDDLMKAVWPNVTVEENAIQAHVAALRKVFGHEAELLCTVHGYGYRLASAQDIPQSDPQAAAASGARWRRAHSLLAAGLAISLGAASLWLFRSAAPDAQAKGPAQVAILPFEQAGTSTELKGLASDLMDTISAELTEARIIIASSADHKSRLPWVSGPVSNTEFLFGGRIRSDGKQLNVHVQLSDAREHVAVWSGTFQESVTARKALIAKVAAAVARVSRWAVLGRTGPVRLDAANVAALIAARESISGGPRNATVLETENYKKIIATAPDFTWGHSGLAVGEAFQLRFDPENQALRQDVKREANRALELDPHNGEAYVALELSLSRWNWKEREALLLKGIEADPSFEPTAMMEARLLWSVGRNHDALAWFKRAYNIDPLHNDNVFTYTVSLAAEGHPADSQTLLELMRTKWPDSTKTRDAHFWSSMLSGATGEVLVMVADPKQWPMGMNRKSAEVWRLALTASRSNDSTARLRAIGAIKDSAADGSLIRGEALLLLSLLNDVDGAFAQAGEYEPSDPRWGPFLFLGPTQVMRQDLRFMPLAVKLGFAAYWRSTGQWPDFCKSPDLPYDCKAEVQKLAAQDPELKPTAGTHRLAATN
ncbi:MAG TPA: winged helix-turn-helix domain-containing protein [Rhizomicrobium sp.]|nr:winged helix-turn-helix domain-containing protein [Rhizomicrobium sp.]